MAIESATLARQFRFGSMTVNDPDPSLSPVQVRDLLSGAYPEITASEVGEGEVKNGALVFSFNRPLGTKG
jgi:PRTRC genetic system protein C